jgi:hypothetical protein
LATAPAPNLRSCVDRSQYSFARAPALVKRHMIGNCLLIRVGTFLVPDAALFYGNTARGDFVKTAGEQRRGHGGFRAPRKAAICDYLRCARIGPASVRWRTECDGPVVLNAGSITPGRRPGMERFPQSIGTGSSDSIPTRSRSPLKFFLLVFARSVPFLGIGAVTGATASGHTSRSTSQRVPVRSRHRNPRCASAADRGPTPSLMRSIAQSFARQGGL